MHPKYKILIATVIICGIGLFIINYRSVPPKEATWKDVLAESEKGGYQLIETGELWDKYQQSTDQMLIVDTRQDWEFKTGHIKGAVNFSMEPTWWARWQKRGALEALLGADKSRVIVFY